MAVLLGQSPQQYNGESKVYGNTIKGYTAISPAFISETVEYIIIKAGRVGTSGNVTIKVYDTSYTPDELAAFANGTTINLGSEIGSKTIDSSGWSTNPLTERTFTFSSPIELPVPNELIVFTVEHLGGDIDNCINWAYTTGSSWTKVQSIDGGTAWTKEQGIINIFQTWGTKLLIPGKPTNPSPTDAVSNITLDESPLSWDASNPAADTYEIYYREQGDSWVLIGVAQAGVSYILSFGNIDYGITYEWRIDATNAVGTTTGDTWSFNSIVYDPPVAGASGGGGGSSGENNMMTLRRLVAAANNKIWYEDI